MADKPVHGIRIGSVKALIWENQTDKGPRHNTTIERLYLDDGEWKTTKSFGRDDLLVVGKIADQAHTWIHQQHDKNASSQ